mmetsp:Transcript_21377/g.23798  ORF Transcript_21377/g.23798 Transcript_21377/m.23798 type:complete len:222 (-) Transcript_21377:156-821(-)|eukprot:CAMPEP_0205819888 /NCGR_PEP_ID=MMETSP0206-20130828/2386_1 /ASSEMBLY_ACC=CAM_ASM_000279 /TAXON_ID=36767 /ORGANISM="Euplotes focardii, Strain TN1" /LENGTH=221 /DNA_ID=CAMNT_0053113965 /DNA_START=320 /DNA_END=985 /DNA_ORIENTATION=+
MLTFHLEYQSYFDNVNIDKPKDTENQDDVFCTRAKTMHLIPEEFSLDVLCQDPQNNQEEEVDHEPSSLDLSFHSDTDNPQNIFYSLKSFVGYYGFHYMSFIKQGDIWHLTEDTKTKEIGDFNQLLDYIEKCKIIPYLVFYERIYKKIEEKLINLEASTESTNDWEISSADKKDIIGFLKNGKKNSDAEHVIEKHNKGVEIDTDDFYEGGKDFDDSDDEEEF